jgi:hypothetical protein
MFTTLQSSWSETQGLSKVAVVVSVILSEAKNPIPGAEGLRLAQGAKKRLRKGPAETIGKLSPLSERVGVRAESPERKAVCCRKLSLDSCESRNDGSFAIVALSESGLSGFRRRIAKIR